MKNRTTCNQRSALDTARIEALRARIERQGSMCLNAETFRMLRYEGLSQRDVDRAIETMAASGQVDFDTTLGVVRVRFAGTRKVGK